MTYLPLESFMHFSNIKGSLLYSKIATPLRLELKEQQSTARDD